MIDPILNRVCKKLESWCVSNNILFDYVCDEADVQGIMIFKKNRDAIDALLQYLESETKDIHVETKNTRGGTIIVFSIKAIAEKFNKIIAKIDEEFAQMSFIDKINLAFERPIRIQQQPKAVESKEINFLESAFDIIGKKKKLNDDKLKNVGISKGASKGASKGSKLRYESRIAKAFGVNCNIKPNRFQHALYEALEGIATPTNVQPNEVFKKFAHALRVLGQRMGIGPLQDKLRSQGISWKQSDDGLAIILTIKNASTGADQPIARISNETLQNPSEFETQLKNMLDFATGDAPGAFEQKEKEIQNNRKTIGDIAKAMSPQDQQQNDIAQQMNAGIGQETMAAQTAAMPK